MTSDRSPGELAELFSDIARELGTALDANAALDALVVVAARRVDGAEYAGITVGRDGERFQTVAATDDVVRRVDQIQYELGSGPCVDAVVDDTTCKAPDLRDDPRWPEFGPRCVEETGIVSMLSTRFCVESVAGLIAGLNMYSHRPAAFDEESEAVAHLLATHGSVVVGRADAQAKSRNLLRALETSREIGMAMGIIMATHKVPRDQAFDLLRIASQHRHRKLAEIAAEVAETGTLPEQTGGTSAR
jgi:ANTAR domain/GAF domain